MGVLRWDMECVRAWNVAYDLAAGESRIFLPIEPHTTAHKSDNGQCSATVT
jgi:hypothetical protein